MPPAHFFFRARAVDTMPQCIIMNHCRPRDHTFKLVCFKKLHLLPSWLCFFGIRYVLICVWALYCRRCGHLIKSKVLEAGGWGHHTYPFILHALLLFLVIGIQGDGLPPIATLYVLADSENVAPHHHCDDEVQHSRYECEHNMICAEAFDLYFSSLSRAV